MRGIIAAIGVVIAALAASTSAQDPDSHSVVDPETGLTFSEYINELGIHYRIAAPANVSADSAFDAVVQIAAPREVGWTGLAWGGSMTYNPLTIVWLNGSSEVALSSRMALSYFVPPPYPDAKYTRWPNGTHVNATHFQVTALCTGCTRWGDADTGVTTLNASGQNPLAFAYSLTAPDTPSAEDSNFGIHDLIGHFLQDFSQGTNSGL